MQGTEVWPRIEFSRAVIRCEIEQRCKLERDKEVVNHPDSLSCRPLCSPVEIWLSECGEPYILRWLSLAALARRTAQQCLCANQIAWLRHHATAKREPRRIVAQSHPLQGAESITGRVQTCRRCDQWVHRNPAKLVTLTLPCFGINVPTSTTDR